MSSSASEALVGRDDVRWQLRESIGRSDGREARWTAIVGEPGIGKSSLLKQSAADAVEAGATVLWARGRQAESQFGFANLHQLLSPLLDDTEELPAQQRESLLGCFGMAEPDEVNPFFVSLAVLELLVRASRESPVVVCLDDMHWMDRSTLDTLAFVARRIADEQVSLLGTARGEGFAPGDDVPVALVTLGPLSDEASRNLLNARSPELDEGLQDRVVRVAAGNPLALVELATAVERGGQAWDDLDPDLPMTTRLERAFAARADEANPLTRAVLDVAALDDGDDLDTVLEAATILAGTETDRSAVLPAIDLGLITLSDTGYAFAHPLIGSALRHAMTRERRRQTHAALATVLAEQPERAVWHLAGSVTGRDELAAARLEETADVARSRGAYATAMARLERAAALSPDPQDRAARLIGAAELGYELGRHAEVDQITTQVSAMTLRPRDRSRLIRLEGIFHDGSTSEPADVRHLVDLARGAQQEGDTDLAMQLLFGAARRVWWRDPGDEVRAVITHAAREMSLPSTDPRLLAVFGLAESLELSAPVIHELDRSPNDGGGRADLAALHGIAAFCAGDFVRADTWLSAAINDLRAQGRLSLLAEALAIRAWAEVNLGVFDAARSADEGARLADETGQRVWAGTSRLAKAAVDAVHGRGEDHDELIALAEHTALALPNASSSLLAGAQMVRGIRELGRDRPDQAYGELARVLTPTDPAYQRVQQVWTLGYLAEAAMRAGRRDDALACVDAIEAVTHGSEAVGVRLPLEYAYAALAPDDVAETRFEEALAGAAQQFPWHQARLRLAYGSWLRRQRRVTESRDPLRSARTVFEALGATPWALRADQELRATGERGWQPTVSNQEELSPQESQIAALAARGLSNREIGQQLFLSHRTVGSHLYRVFPKLGITSRQQLAQAMASIGSITVGPVPSSMSAASQSSD